MNISFFPDKEKIDTLLEANEPVLVLCDFEGKNVLVGDIDEYLEHHILLEAAGYDSRDIDKFFRLVADGEGADWTFICPTDYKGIENRQRRIERFYKDGLELCKEALKEIGLETDIFISKRYRRRFDYMNE